MSKRVTTQTEIKDREIAMSAFKSAGISFTESGSGVFSIQTGRSHGTLDLRSGTISGDDMSFRQSDFDSLKQHYAKEKTLKELLRAGASVQSQTTESNGDIVIVYQTA